MRHTDCNAARRMGDVATIYRLAAQSDPIWVLRLEGNLEGESVDELRREWLRLHDADGAIPVLIELENADVDEGGSALLAELRQAGTVVVVSCGAFEARRVVDAALAGWRRS